MSWMNETDENPEWTEDCLKWNAILQDTTSPEMRQSCEKILHLQEMYQRSAYKIQDKNAISGSELLEVLSTFDKYLEARTIFYARYTS